MNSKSRKCAKHRFFENTQLKVKSGTTLFHSEVLLSEFLNMYLNMGKNITGAISHFLNITGAIAPVAPVLNTPLFRRRFMQLRKIRSSIF